MSHENTELMREIRSLDDRGQPVYDPMPPRLNARLLASKDPVEQLMGWMFWFTIRWRPKPSTLDSGEPFRNRTPYAADEFGRALGLKDAAVFFRPRWSIRKARQVWQRATARGWVQKRDGKLYLRGDAPCKIAIASEDGPSDSTPIDPVQSYIDSLPPYVMAAVVKLPREKQERLVVNLKAHESWEKEVQADAMMAARDKTQPIRIQIFDAFGIALKVGPKTQAYQEKRKTCAVQLELFGGPLLNLPRPLQSPNGHAKNGASHVKQNSAVLNSNGAENGNTEQMMTPPPTARAAEPTNPPFLASADDARIPDAEFKQSIIAAFVDAGRPHPTPGQVRSVMETLPDHALARGAYLDDLRKSMPRIKHPGVLDSHTRGFAAAWPAKLDKLEAERAQATVTLPGYRPLARGEAVQSQIDMLMQSRGVRKVAGNG